MIPFIASTRKQHDDWVEGTPVPLSMSAVSWCDGENAQVKVVIDEEAIIQFKNLRIIANKQHAAQSATEQAEYLTTVFKIMHKLQHEVSAEKKFHLLLKKNPEIY